MQTETLYSPILGKIVLMLEYKKIIKLVKDASKCRQFLVNIFYYLEANDWIIPLIMITKKNPIDHDLN